MAVPFLHTSFAAGEMAPSLYGRVDFAKYAIGGSTIRNAWTFYGGGGAWSRAGTKFVGFSKQTGRAFPPRVIRFQFNINQGLSLEFGNFYMRVISNGEFVTEAPKAITGITQANPAVVTSVAHGFVTGDWVFISGVNGMTQVNGQTYVITVLTADTFSLQNVYGSNIDSTAFGAYTAAGSAARIFTLVTPYAEADIPWLKFIQSADTTSICCRNQHTGTEYPAYDLARITDANWTITAANFGPKITPPTFINVTPTVFGSGASSTTFNTAYAYVVTAVNGITGEESIASPIGNCTNSVDISLTAGSLKVNWGSVAGAAYYNLYRAPAFFGNGGTETVPAGSLFGYVATSYGTSFVDSNVVPDLSQVPPLAENPFARGQILRIAIATPGSGLSTVSFLITTATGSGFAGYPVINGGSMTTFVVTNAGQNYLPGDTIAFSTAGFASGNILFAADPGAGDTITLNGRVWTFVAAITGPYQTVATGTLANTLVNLGSQLQASGNALLTVAEYSVDGTHLFVSYRTAGVAGNAYTLAASVATPSAATLTGGAGPGGGTAPTGTLVIGPESGTYPSVVSYIQQRRVYANTANQPDTYFMSQPGKFLNFDTRVPTSDADAITGTPWSLQVDGIQWMIPMPGGLVVLTGLQAWQLTGSGGGSSLNPQPITPSNQIAQPQAYNGCNELVQPVQIGQDIIYLQAKGSIFRELNYNYFLNIYTGVDITVLSNHLFTNYTILASAWCEEPFKLLWVARSDGQLLSLTYQKEQEILAWTRHDTQGYVWSVCSVTEPPVDALYLATQRFPTTGAAYMIERMDNRIWPSLDQTWCVDCGLSLPQTAPNAGLQVSSRFGAGIPAGVTDLVGGAAYPASTTAALVDRAGEGSGTTVTITFGAGGSIASVAFAGGGGYVDPLIVLSDPTNSGRDFSATVLMNNTATFTASAPAFDPTMIGSVIRGPQGSGQAVIVSYLSTTSVLAQVTFPFPAFPDAGGVPAPMGIGTWTVSAPTQFIAGLNHLIGLRVTGVADGQVITPRVVQPDGSITLDSPASNVVVGLGFQAQVQTLPLDTGNPTSQGQRKKIVAVTARVQASGLFEVGSNQVDGSALNPQEIEVEWVNLAPANISGLVANKPYGSNVTPLYTGDVRIPVGGGFGKPGQAAIQQSLPLPLQVNAVIPEDLPGDTPEVAEKKKEQGQGQAAPQAPRRQAGGKPPFMEYLPK